MRCWPSTAFCPAWSTRPTWPVRRARDASSPTPSAMAARARGTCRRARSAASSMPMPINTSSWHRSP
ncbi:hypothetical protein G6F60_015285 [Rhizopus arrhizus]|nr:hypothetical protein G6F60_015285 [Rhizopus arrhizus]